MKKKLLSISEAAKILGVSIDTLRNWEDKGVLKSFRPHASSKRYYQPEHLENFLKNETGTIPENIETKAIKWASGKTATETSPDLYCETNDIFSARLQSLSIKLSKITEIKEIFPLLIAVAGEIGNNSYNHNIGSWPDVPGVFFGYDMQKKLIILADRGQGILKTLKRVLPELKNDQEALQIAFTRYISARAPEDRGNGLKFVKDIILSNPIKLLFYSGQILLEIDKNSGLKFKKNKIKFPGCLAIINY